MSCEKCGGEGWIVRERKGISGVEPCECRRSGPGSARFKERGIPLTLETAGSHIAMLCDCLAFSPGEMGRGLIVNALMDMCSTEDESLWVVNRAVSLYVKWTDCGVPGLRQIVSAFRVPKDGMSLLFTEAYPHGVDGIRQGPASASPQRLTGPAAEVPEIVTADPEMQAAVERVAVERVRVLKARPEDVAKVSPADRKRALEFGRILDDLDMGQQALPEIKRKPIKQSEIQTANAEPDPTDKPLPEGAYQRITRDNFEELLRLEREQKQKKESA